MLNAVAPRFAAIPKATYTLPYADRVLPPAKVTIYELEKDDVDFVQTLETRCEYFEEHSGSKDENMYRKNLQSAMTKAKLLLSQANEISHQLVSWSRETSLTEQDIKKRESSPVVLLAVEKKAEEPKGRPYGILIGNMPKRNQDGSLTHTTRNLENETELNWLMLWENGRDGRLRGLGTVLSDQFVMAAQEKGFDQVYVRSELPEKSVAERFYKALGFLRLAPEAGRVPEGQLDLCVYLEKPDYKPIPDPIVPMGADIGTLLLKEREHARRYSLVPQERKSVPIEEVATL